MKWRGAVDAFGQMVSTASAINSPLRFAYVGGRPTRYIDPYGLEGMDWLWGAIYETTGYDPDQSTVDSVAGFGDGVSSALTFGFYSTSDLRDSLGIGGVNKCSSSYKSGSFGGSLLGGGIYGGGLVSLLGKQKNIRQSYQNGLANGLLQNLSPRHAHALRRYLGAELKRKTPWLFRQWIYRRNIKKYRDPLGPWFDPIKNNDVVKTLTDTNWKVNLLVGLPSRGLAPSGIAGGAAAGGALANGECECE